jgi:hypothetical protein
MVMAPTCVTCGSFLMGYGWDPELNFPVYFCLTCSPHTAPAPKAEVPAGVLKEAA